MIRTQIQLTEEQSTTLKELSRQRGVSVAELVRQSVDYYLRSTGHLSNEERKRRALSVVGIVASGVDDLATNHDKYLTEAYGDYQK